jgi:hypothetical protein
LIDAKPAEEVIGWKEELDEEAECWRKSAMLPRFKCTFPGLALAQLNAVGGEGTPAKGPVSGDGTLTPALELSKLSVELRRSRWLSLMFSCTNCWLSACSDSTKLCTRKQDQINNRVRSLSL